MVKFTFCKEKLLIIAELGLSHLGKFEKAIDLIDGAKYAGADAVKFQVYRAEDIWTLQDDIDRRNKLQLKLEEYDVLVTYAKSIGLHVGSSLFGAYGCDLGFDFIKVASRSYPCFVDFPDPGYRVRREMRSESRPVLISCGNFMPSIPVAGYAYLSCVSEYPTNKIPFEQFRYLQAIGATWGHSSHFELGQFMDCIAAINAGASIIEKHICLDREEIEIDKAVCLTIEEFKTMNQELRNAFAQR